MLRDGLFEVATGIPDEIWEATEAEIRSLAQPTPTDYALRASFWREYERAMSQGTGKVSAQSVYSGVCSQQYWNSKLLKKPAKVAWLLRPMQVYEKELEAILHRGTERLWEIIDMPITDSKGRHDPKRAQVVLAALKQVEDRVKGMAVQRQQKLQINVNEGSRETRIMAELESIDSVDQRIKELEARISGTASDHHHPTDSQEEGDSVSVEILDCEPGERLREPVVELEDKSLEGPF